MQHPLRRRSPTFVGRAPFMRRPCSVLILFVLLGFGVSLGVPAEDVPETAYDESEALPYEMTPPLSGDLAQESPPILQLVPIVPSSLFSTPKHALGRAGYRGLAAHSIPDSLTILDHTLRC
jgi:hypothetical protein